MRTALTFAVVLAAALCGWAWWGEPAPPPAVPQAPSQGANIDGPIEPAAAPALPAPRPSAVPTVGARSTPSRRAPTDHEAVTAARPQRINHADGSVEVNFPYLAQFKALVPGPSPDAPLAPGDIPAHIRQLDGQPVLLRGFMIALKVEDRLATEFLLSRFSYEQCCFGVAPQPNEWVVVNAPRTCAVEPLTEGTVEVRGRFAVGAELNEAGELVSVYRLRAERIVAQR